MIARYHSTKAEGLRENALTMEESDPRGALDLLWQTVEQYPRTWTADNCLIDDIIRIGERNGFWDDAIRACVVSQKLRPDIREDLALHEQALRLEKDGRHIEATEVRLKLATQRVRWHGTLRYYADRFADLGAHDRAWQLYDEAAAEAMKSRESPHMARQGMSELLLKEGRPDAAVQIMISGICEAHQTQGEFPQTVVKSLRRALRAAGFNLRENRFRNLPDEIVNACTTKGRKRALKLYEKAKRER